MNEKEVKGKLYQFSFEVAQFPPDENIRELKGLLNQVLATSTNQDVNSKARLAIMALNKTAKFKTLERRKQDFLIIGNYISRVAHYR